MRKFTLIVAALSSFASIVFAQTDTINASNHKLVMSRVKTQTASYLVYLMDSATQKPGYTDLWVRSLRTTTRDNKPVVAFKWQWYRHDSIAREVTGVADAATFAPIFESTYFPSRGILAYDFKNGYMMKSDTVAGNKVPDGKITKLDLPIFNWEMDMETFGLLPIKKAGQKFVIAFFDPNGPKPAYYTYEITGEETIALNGEAGVKCWTMRIQYEPEAYAIFWITKQSHEMIKLKEYFKGKYRFKVKLY
ncbi:hypothetical protein CLV51_108144 [Chitinophaga niastensis]|uniref:DUF3108 domain-containing protein n=1 Tax=Chitinophaga niastensis TaxID=536980 RepID=A0A2P8HB65_CHINA|nr:hypothetical protein [Chitinophaga niastensis]PSL43454.1 hypothetical protein CLV51_108144 [Chitinophaga niastensis]